VHVQGPWQLTRRTHYLAFPGIPEAVGPARHYVRDTVPPHLADAAALLASELIANAGAPRGALLYPRLSREELKGGCWA
jgi:hypothetical protein